MTQPPTPTPTAPPPQSPRAQTERTSIQRPKSYRSPSISSVSSAQLTEMLIVPQGNNKELPSSRWEEITVKLMLEGQVFTYIDADTSIEEACAMLVEKDLTSLPIRVHSDGKDSITRTFDYSDLCAFLLLVLGVGDSHHDADFQDAVKTARLGGRVPVTSIADLGLKDAFTTVPNDSKLGTIAEILGTGIHRVGITDPAGSVVGVISQRTFVSWLWENIRAFPALEELHAKTIADLKLGSREVTSITGEARVIDAFRLMNSTGISSLAVVDPNGSLLGNISVVDTKYVTRSSSTPILINTCTNFLGIIKFEQGIRMGRDSAPTFHITRNATLSYTVAKLCATKTHRLWITASGGGTNNGGNNSNYHHGLDRRDSHNGNIYSPLVPPGTTTSPRPGTPQIASSSSTPSPPATTSTSNVSVPVQTYPQNMNASSSVSMSSGSTSPHINVNNSSGTIGSGTLTGVVSLTDVIATYVAQIGGKADPGEAARTRRRSSASSSGDRPRISVEDFGRRDIAFS